MGWLMYLCFLVFLLNSQVGSSSFTSNSSSTHLCPHDQSFALLRFKNILSFNSHASGDDKSYPKMVSWKEGTDCCSWDGVTCDRVMGHVIGLDLNSSWLNGTIHSNSSLFLLSHLQWLNLADNYFRNSRISSEFGRFASLTQLNLSWSIFSGQIPSEISHLSKLVSLDLSRNVYCKLETLSLKRLVQNLTELRELFLSEVDMSSVQPSSLMNLSSSLTSLKLGSCGLRGKFVDHISHLPNLQILDLSNNNFKGELPDSIGNLQSLNYLDLHGTSFSRVPDTIGSLRYLNYLDLSDTNFSGELPDSIGNLQSLNYLDLAGSSFSGLPDSIGNLLSLNYLDLSSMNFSGEVPDSIGNLQSLNYLDLSYSNFFGCIPAFLGNLTQMTDLDLSYNHFICEIPSSLSNLGQLSSLRFSGNNLSGQLPFSIANLTRLVTLDLSSNRLIGLAPSQVLPNNLLVGPIPFQVLPNLQQLDLSYNSLNETIPSWLLTLPSLLSLDLSYNKLTGLPNSQLMGPIPSQVLPNLNYLDISHNSLNGTIPSWVFNLPSLWFLDLSHNKLMGHIHEFQSNSLERIYLDHNELHAPIPRSIFQLVNLTVLTLSSNKLSEVMELDKFSKLKNLHTLDLSYNNLSWSTNNNVNSTLPKFLSLTLSSCNLSEFPNFLRTLENLESLDLSNNKIHGQMPNWMWDVGKHSLNYLNLSSNFLTSVAQLPWNNLQTLDLHSNLLQGPLPIPPLSTGFFFVSNNELTGKIPSLICNVSSLEVLDLSKNNLSGIIPQCLGNFSNDLSVLDLRMNSFHGTIPGTFAKGNSLRNLDFNGNQLEGPIPQSLINCRNLEVLDLGNNKIHDIFPYWLDTLPELQVLVLRSNRFHGPIGDSKTRFPFLKLRIIDLSHNEFTGLLPSKYFKSLKAMMNGDEKKIELGYMGESYYQDSVMVTVKGVDIELVKILTTYTTLDLSNNRFRGNIPKSIGKLTSLRLLNFSCNGLMGHIPSSLENLGNLESLDLSSNNLSGKIPEQLTSLTFLAFLNLSQNHLVGSVPRGKQFDTFQNDSYNENLGLCGVPLSKNCNDDEAPQSPPLIFQEDNDLGSASGFEWKVVLMGYGCGMVFGLVMGYLIFLTGKPKWFVRIVEGDRRKQVKRSNTSAHRQGGRRN